MEHVEIINKIIEAEHQAQRIAKAAINRRENMQADLKVAQKNLRESYLERARRRIDAVREREQSLAEETIAQLDARFADDKEAMETEFAKHREEWTDKLVSLIVGEQK